MRLLDISVERGKVVDGLVRCFWYASRLTMGRGIAAQMKRYDLVLDRGCKEFGGSDGFTLTFSGYTWESDEKSYSGRISFVFLCGVVRKDTVVHEIDHAVMHQFPELVKVAIGKASKKRNAASEDVACLHATLSLIVWKWLRRGGSKSESWCMAL